MTEHTIGQLDRRLMLQEAVRAADGAGGATVSWSLIAEVWAAVLPVSGGEGLDGEGLRARATHAVWLRHRDGVKPDMRFVFGTRILDIRSVAEMSGRRRFLRCLCEERVT
jgi:SPP1 family predicted phage head-tail adaptor